MLCQGTHTAGKERETLDVRHLVCIDTSDALGAGHAPRPPEPSIDAAVVVGHGMDTCGTDLAPASQLPRPPEHLDMLSPDLVRVHARAIGVLATLPTSAPSAKDRQWRKKKAAIATCLAETCLILVPQLRDDLLEQIGERAPYWLPVVEGAMRRMNA